MNKQQGIINIPVLIIVIIIGGLGYLLLSNKGEDVVSTSSIPTECQEFKGDTCGLFSCMTPSCWCKDDPLGGVVYQEEMIVEDGDVAVKIVTDYLKSINSERIPALRDVRLNSFFFNVFATDEQFNEEVFTVSEDGKILKTICGV